MALLDSPAFVALLLILVSFLPPVLYLMWIRRGERIRREPWGAVAKVFVFGAVFAVLISLLLYVLLFSFFGASFERVYEVLGQRFGQAEWIPLLVLAVAVAPVVEELAKALGVLTVRRQIDEAEDGLVYGASSGLGFSATENLLYGATAYLTVLTEEGGTATAAVQAAVILILVRSVSSSLLHASATASTGYGIGNARLFQSASKVLPYFLLAVIMHAVFNFLASLGFLYGDAGALIGFFAALIFAAAAIGIVRVTIRRRDAAGPGVA